MCYKSDVAVEYGPKQKYPLSEITLIWECKSLLCKADIKSSSYLYKQGNKNI